MPTLHWLTREQDLKAAANAEYRLLAEEEQYSYGDPDAGNLIVQGDNLAALKALLPFYAGQVKCIYIDPPYNTGSAFEHYDDNMEHTLWLSMMYPRLELLKKFLAKEGAIFIQLDDSEQAYAKVICDEIFGRNNFVANIIWQKKYSPQNDAKWLSDNHDFIMLYARDKEMWRPNLLPRTEEMNARYRNPDNDVRGVWKPADLSAKTYSAATDYSIKTPSGRMVNPPKSRCWTVSKETFIKLVKDNRIWFGPKGDSVPAMKKFLTEVKQGATALTIWLYQEVGHNQDAKKEVKILLPDDAFSTPKPERLMQRILTLSTNPGDYVLDSFLGSGTTAAVAHKMGRRYIGVEMGEQAKTHCAARLKKVIDGEQGGISKAVGWEGGGGFRFFKLGDAVFDNERRIKPGISFENLAAHVYFTETKTPMKKHEKNSTFLGIHDGTAYALLYNGILGDKRVNGGNVLTQATLNHIRRDMNAVAKNKGEKFACDKWVIYGEATRLTPASLAANNIVFKQTPYDIKVW
ncbi:MAG: site-specific DNA-methyltransferase [Zoogloeaceae bacterium]|jgi:adenine-specific DNA-methyltransferase|nr:site-specific DNA-methyltransferase [Zoogloeaceae bacterium]